MPAATCPTLHIPKEERVNRMNIYEHGYQQYELAKMLTAPRQRRQRLAGGDWAAERDNEMDHKSLLFYLHRTREDTARKTRYQIEDPLWSVAERGGRWAGQVLTLPRRLVHSTFAVVGYLRSRVSRQPATPE